MNDTQALHIVESLANGVDPETGEVYPPDSPYQRAPIVRALFAAREALERASESERRRQSLPTNTGAPWAADEDSRLAAAFDEGKSLVDLARAHDRTRGAIQARLVKLGKMRP
jgi:hypothetical protein